jgi:tetratricopeptide (TPR) repeat protein
MRSKFCLWFDALFVYLLFMRLWLLEQPKVFLSPLESIFVLQFPRRFATIMKSFKKGKLTHSFRVGCEICREGLVIIDVNGFLQIYNLTINKYFPLPHFRSVKAFQELLYINPDFQRANEVHVRLGFMFKVIGDYEKSLKHYNLALLDQSSSCTFTTAESEFCPHSASFAIQ